MRTARHNYFSKVIALNYNAPAALFSTINRLLNPIGCFTLTPSLEVCEIFWKFFVEKVEKFRISVTTSSAESVMPPAWVLSSLSRCLRRKLWILLCVWSLRLLVVMWFLYIFLRRWLMLLGRVFHCFHCFQELINGIFSTHYISMCFDSVIF